MMIFIFCTSIKLKWKRSNWEPVANLRIKSWFKPPVELKKYITGNSESINHHRWKHWTDITKVKTPLKILPPKKALLATRRNLDKGERN